MPDHARPIRSSLQLPTLIALTATSLLSAFIFLPSVGSIAQSLSTSVNGVQLSIAAYQGVFAVATLAIGRAADAWDRRRLLVLGGLLVAVGGIGTAFSSSLAEFVGWRLVQAVGAATALVVGRALVIDLFPKDRAVAAMASLSGTMALVPMLAPVLGGLLDHALGWRGIFGLLSAYCLVAAGLAVWLLASPAASRHDPTAEVDASSTWALLRNRQMIGYCAAVAMGSFTFHLYAVSAPAFLVASYGFDAPSVGIALALAPVGFFLSMFFVRRRARLGGPSVETVLRRCAISVTLIGAIVGLLMFTDAPAWVALAPFCALGFSNGWVLPNAFAGAVRASRGRQGTASGLLTFTQLAGTTIASLLASAVPVQSPWWLGLGIVAAGLGGLALAPRAQKES